ncbi:serine/threonine-protein kinase prpf4B isoform X2 [Rhodamnia argentea]|uniref:non-specific serine/threonine protein kinase n=1 Tax=Rhodamnia argentea TaxID=178133 RepID=A0A8B8QYB8_9MYRT|nr:serine/threonine-protein kinase prpf4B isoform X2 [Rhodamnia argentea]
MATGASEGEPRRKHRRSSSPSRGDEEDDADRTTSKRHKHRHHRHRHGRSHRHASKKAVEEAGSGGDGVDSSSPPPPLPPAVALPPPPPASSRHDDDVEEGEILEEDASEPVEEFKNLVSKSESGVLSAEGSVGVVSGNSNSMVDELQSAVANDSKVNGGIGHESFRKDKSHGSRLHSKGNEKAKNRYTADTMESRDSDAGDPADRHKTSPCSPSSDIYRDDGSRSQDSVRERSRSQSSLPYGGSPLKRRNHIERESSYLSEKSKIEYDPDDQNMTRRSKDKLHNTRDIVKDEERERINSNRRYGSTEDQHHSRERSNRDKSMGSNVDAIDRRREDREKSKDRDVEPVHRKKSERERSKDRDVDRDYRKKSARERSIGRELEWDRGREKERELSRERGLERDGRRDREREMSRERDIDRDRRREREREMSRETDIDRDRRREIEIERSWERDMDRDRRREKRRERSIERDKERDRRRERERERERSWDRPRDGRRDKDRERIRERSRDRSWKSERLDDGKREERRDARGGDKYENVEDGYVDKHGYSKHPRRNEVGDDIDGISRGFSTKMSAATMDDDKEVHTSDEDDLDGKFSLEIAEQEEEDVNRIKEESRRRRQAIMEKYKNMQQQQQEEHVQPQAEDAVEDKARPKKSTAEVPGSIAEGGDLYVAEPSFSIGKSPIRNGITANDRSSGERGLGEGTPKSEGSDDIFCDDIFGDSPAGARKMGKGGGLPVERSGLHDNWDDAEGYYSYRFGEILDGRYEVIAAHGKGVFSTVVRAKDLKAGIGEPEEVAIKILRNKEAMYKAGVEELGILKKLVGADPEDKRHCVRLLSSFKAYAKQLFIALKHLRNCGVLHCDIKPDNVLVNEAKNVLKLCDFGNAMYAGKNEITPYLVSRFYRAPEIILGLPYDHPLDMWSVGCCLYELYAGKVLFPGPSNNDMLRLHMELKGPFPKKLLRKAAFADQHFDADLNFLAIEEDSVTKKSIRRMILNIKPKDIGSIIKGSPGEDPKMLANFKDLLDKIFVLDPDKRMTVQQALNHPFITELQEGLCHY